MTAVLEVSPLAGRPNATLRLPGSKSLTNRALVAAALADGESVLVGALVADDTEAMVECLRQLGARVEFDGPRTLVTGIAQLRPGPIVLNARLSGTTSRFLLPVLALGEGWYVLDGGVGLRDRPMGPSFDALRALGADVLEEGQLRHLPARVTGSGLRGGFVEVDSSTSSQFVSGLLLASARAQGQVTVRVTGEVVSRPYLDLTVGVMRAFGAQVDQQTHERFVVEPTGYRPAEYTVEPDATAASYFFAAAAITDGAVTVPGLGLNSPQGDIGFVDVLEQMGAVVTRSATEITVRGTGRLHGVDVNLADLSDTAQTLAAVAVFADSPTTVRGVGFIRDKETDRIAHPVAELRRCGIQAVETVDGFVVYPGSPHPATINTYDDHRMAMSFALLGLRTPGIRISDPGCVSKTFPGYWDALESLHEREPERGSS